MRQKSHHFETHLSSLSLLIKKLVTLRGGRTFQLLNANTTFAFD